MKNILLFGLFLGICTPAHGMWKHLLTQAIRNKKTLFTTATAAALTGTAYAKRETLAQKLDDTRLDILKQKKLKIFKKIYPICFQALVTDPLLRKIPYNSLTEYVQESDEATQRRQTIARTLCAAGVPLGVSQTEADILAYEYNKDKKALIADGIWGPYIQTARFKLTSQKIVPSRATLDAMLQAEKNFSAQDNQVLYHGMHPGIYALDYVGTKLQFLHDEQSFLGLRQTLIHDQLKDQNLSLAAENNMREKILRRPCHEDKNSAIAPEDLPPDTNSTMRKYLISCSPAILSGTRYLKSSGSLESALYFFVHSYAANGNMHIKTNHNISEETIGRSDKKLQAAVDKFSQACLPSAVMLQMSLSPELMDKATYPSLPRGYKHNIYTKTTPPHKFEKPSELFTEIRNNPFNIHVKHTKDNCSGIDPLQLRLIVDKSLLLDPHNPEVQQGFKIKAYTANQEALDTFHREVDGIVAEIRADMQKTKTI